MATPRLKEKYNKEIVSQLEKDLAQSNADEKVIEAIILSYRVKLEILDQMLAELRKSKETTQKPVETKL